MSDLKHHVLSIIKTIETGIDSDGNEIDVCDYMQDVLDIKYIINSDRSFKGARLLVTFGGPNIWVDTSTNMVEGYWWNEHYEFDYKTDALGLDDYCEEMWGCGG